MYYKHYVDFFFLLLIEKILIFYREENVYNCVPLQCLIKDIFRKKKKKDLITFICPVICLCPV